MWLVFSIEFFNGIDLGWLGIRPRTFTGLIGIFTAPLIHGNLAHLLSNTLPLLFLGSVIFFFYERIGGIVFFRCYIITNTLVWLLSPRVSYHIGASGLVYGLSAFLIFFGFIRKDFWSLLISVIVFLMYGGIFYGVLPTDPRVSWESHLAGAVVGIYTAFDLKNTRRLI
ncbi:MAG: rhomboid family intramembrane serine protease [Cyclobacteriaceae bacterium]|nr:rhomboid family intramembrane serine protease [Cyclobacteriaceae bacterium]